MRQAVFVVVLVGASFLGGAFVNGPGLQWAQNRVLRSLGLNDGGEITTVNLSPIPGVGPSSSDLGPAKPAAVALEEPIAPMPSLITEGEPNKQDTSRQSSVARVGLNASSPNPRGQDVQRLPGLGSLKKSQTVASSTSGQNPAPFDSGIALTGAAPLPNPSRTLRRAIMAQLLLFWIRW